MLFVLSLTHAGEHESIKQTKTYVQDIENNSITTKPANELSCHIFQSIGFDATNERKKTLRWTVPMPTSANCLVKATVEKSIHHEMIHEF